MNARKSKSSLRNQKRFEKAYARRPVQCQHCQDFILGTSNPLMVCQQCKAILHPICAEHGGHVHGSDCFNSMSDYQMMQQDQLLSSKAIPISEWTSDIVREWIAASESHRYFYVFNSSKTKFVGDNLVDPTEIITSFRADELHKTMLREAIHNAQFNFPLPADFGDQGPNMTATHHHDFSGYECYCTFHCAKCKLSRGVMSYGVKCRKCGMRFHRMCRLLPCLPPCLNRHGLPKEYIFGQDLALSYTNSSEGIPLFLKLCTKVIEERLQPTDKSIYVSSAKCIRLQELCSQHGFDAAYDNKSRTFSPPVLSYDAIKAALRSIQSLDELAGLLKSYLRELPNPVIPFSVYDDMVSLAKKGFATEEEIRAVAEKIPLPHRHVLSHIIEHLQRIHEYLRGADKLSSLFAAFGTILVRPPPQSVKSLASWERGCDYHSVIVKIVFGSALFKDRSAFLNIPNPNPFYATPSPINSDGNSSTQTGTNSDVYIEFSADDPTSRNLSSFSGSGDIPRPTGPNYQRMSCRDGPQPMRSSVTVEKLPEYAEICDLAYYWNNISKSQEKLLMENEAIGNFILRKSGSDPTALTLVVKSIDLNFLVKVEKYKGPEDGWGVAANAPKFATLADLVLHYQSNDLSTSPYLPHGGSSLSGVVEQSSGYKYAVRLREPVNRDLIEDLKSTKEKLVTDSKEVDKHEVRIAKLKKNLSFIRDNEIPHYIKRKEALNKLHKQLDTQLQMLQNGAKSLSLEDKRRLKVSEDMLVQRINMAKDLIEKCADSLETLHNDKISVESDLHKCTTDFSAEIRQQTRRRITLELGGIPYEDDQLNEMQLFNREKHSLWFFEKSVTRDMATSMFEVCREFAQISNGTFLVRKSREGGYAISVWVNGEVMHLKLQYEDKKYGFTYPYINYSSITDLVVAYTETSLVVHNHSLDTTLTTPIGHIIEHNPAIKQKIELIR